MKKLLIIGTYIKNEITEKLVKSALVPLVSEFDVCLVTHSPVSKELQSMVKYYVYDYRNDMIPNSPTFHIWADHPSFYFHSHHVAGTPNHSYAIYRSLMNAILLLKSCYEDFIYIEGDCVFSKEDVEKLKEFPEICQKEKKEALFFTDIDKEMFHSIIFYSTMDFFKNTFPLLKTSKEYLDYCEKMNSWRSLENFMFKCIIHSNVMDQIYDAKNIKKYFSNSKINLSTFDGNSENKFPPYDSHVVCVENSEEIALIFLSKNTVDEEMDVFLDDEKIYTILTESHAIAIKINPKNEQFYIKIGKWPAKEYRKSDILNTKNIDYVRFK